MAISRTSQAYRETSLCLRELTEGLVISIDPSVGSSSSMPGWAVYRAGEYIESGIFQVPLSKSLPEKLKFLNRSLTKLYLKYPPDVLVYEEIPAMRHGFGNAAAHGSLLKALGVILSVPGPENYVGIMPISWKAMVSDDYEKGDEQDARQIGQVIINLAYLIQKEGSDGKKKQNSRK